MRIRFVPVLRATMLVTLALPGAAFAAGQAFVVAPVIDPGVDFTSPQAAIDAASDGDLVLVREGSYGAVTIGDKSVTLLADTQTTVGEVRLERVRVENLAPGKTVVVRGFELGPAVFVQLVTIVDCGGAIVIEDCGSNPGTVGTFDPPTVGILNSNRVVLVRCEFMGAKAIPSTLAQIVGARALYAEASNVFVQGGTLRGGAGANAAALLPGIIAPSTRGGAGVDLVSGFFHAVGATIEGGRGGNGTNTLQGCVPASNGGIGLIAGGAVVRLDTAIVGGAPGETSGGCAPATAGDAIVVTSGSIAVVADVAREFETTSPAFEGQISTTTVRGVPGEAVFMLRSLAAQATYVPALKGALVPAFPLQIVPLGNLPPSGELSFSVTLPVGLLPPAIDFVDLHHQVLVAGASGFGLLGTSSASTIVR
jgi:hypothetical protein